MVDLKEILKEHLLWVAEDKAGVKADLSNLDLSSANLFHSNLSSANLFHSNLSSADLSCSNLSRANLSGTDLFNTNLSRANLSGADLSCSNLSRANLSDADLSHSNLSSADLSCSNLSRANLSGADLSGADLSDAILSPLQKAQLQIVPQTGSFTGYKKVSGEFILELRISKSARRSSALSSRKCRADKVKVVRALNSKNTVFCSKHDSDFIYKVGKVVTEPKFDDRWWVECTKGIHFFLTREEAEDY